MSYQDFLNTPPKAKKIDFHISNWNTKPANPQHDFLNVKRKKKSLQIIRIMINDIIITDNLMQSLSLLFFTERAIIVTLLMEIPCSFYNKDF